MSGTAMGNGLSNGHHDVQLPDDPAAQATLDLSTALRPGAIWPPAGAPQPNASPPPARAARPETSSTPPVAVPTFGGAPGTSAAPPAAPVRLYGFELSAPRAAPLDRASLHAAMSRGLDALAWPSPVPLLEPRAQARSAPAPLENAYESEAWGGEVGDDKRAVYGFDEDDRLSALALGESVEGSDWNAVYGLDGGAEPLDWAALERDEVDDPGEQADEELYEEASASLAYAECDDAPKPAPLAALEEALAGELRQRLAEPRSNLDAVFEAEPLSDEVCCSDERDEELAGHLGEVFDELERGSESAASTGAALSLEDLDRMFDEDFARTR